MVLDPKAQLLNLDSVEAQAKHVIEKGGEPMEQRLASCVVALCGFIRELQDYTFEL